MIRLCRFSLFLLIIMLSACQSIVPATNPPQLSHTPGAPITITDNQIDAGWFMLDYPDGWRIVTNIAIEPLRLTLVSPDETLIIHVDTICDRADATAQADSYHRNECFDVDVPCEAVPFFTPPPGYATPEWCPRDLHISAMSEIEFQAVFDPIFEALISSIEFR